MGNQRHHVHIFFSNAEYTWKCEGKTSLAQLYDLIYYEKLKTPKNQRQPSNRFISAHIECDCVVPNTNGTLTNETGILSAHLDEYHILYIYNTLAIR